MDLFGAAWVTLLGAGLLLEIFALFNKKAGDTLSEHVWDWFSINKRNEGDSPDAKTRVKRIALLSFLTWISVHFLTGGGFV